MDRLRRRGCQNETRQAGAPAKSGGLAQLPTHPKPVICAESFSGQIFSIRAVAKFWKFLTEGSGVDLQNLHGSG